MSYIIINNNKIKFFVVCVCVPIYKLIRHNITLLFEINYINVQFLLNNNTLIITKLDNFLIIVIIIMIFIIIVLIN
jgi:hypothetical protein